MKRKQTKRQAELAHMRAVDSYSEHAVLLRDMAVPRVLGYELDRQTLTPVKRPVPARQPGEDYGADPLGPDADGVFHWRMVPSGDVVDAVERERRLKRYTIETPYIR